MDVIEMVDPYVLREALQDKCDIAEFLQERYARADQELGSAQLLNKKLRRELQAAIGRAEALEARLTEVLELKSPSPKT